MAQEQESTGRDVSSHLLICQYVGSSHRNKIHCMRDGHVNLSCSWQTSQYREWFDAYPRNFSDSLQSNYLKKDYIISSGLTYQILENNIGYIYISSFSNGIGEGNLDQTLDYLKTCDGLIIDVRNNGGGNLTTAAHPHQFQVFFKLLPKKQHYILTSFNTFKK